MRISTRSLPYLAVLALGVAVAAFRSPQAASSVPTNKHLPAIVFVAAPTVVHGELANRFPQGSHLLRLPEGAPSVEPTNLTPGFFAAADPRVSAEGTKLLFVAQSSREGHWQVWEMNADGSGQRQLTHFAGHCFQPAYLPRNEIAFTAVTGSDRERTSSVWVSAGDGTDAHPITFGPGNFQLETVLRDGRILVSAAAPLVPAPKVKSNRTLFVVAPDGTGLTQFRREQFPGHTRTGAEELEDGTVLFLERDGAARQERGGELAWVTLGALHSSVIAPSQSVFWSAHQLDGNTIVVARKNPAILPSKAKLDLYTFDLESKSVGRLVYRNPNFSSVQAVALEPHPVPKYYWSVVHPKSKVGRVICLNAYLSTAALRGRFAGHIARVRVIALELAQNHEQVLGEAPVEADGSFYVEAPADHPIRFELLNTKGVVIQAQHSWIWVRPGEDRACLGCHADPALTPPNRWALALKRPGGPTPVGAAVELQASHH
jgi:Hydrazine synthase alpha subunit middle domain